MLSTPTSERDREITRLKSDHVFMRLCQRYQRENIFPAQEEFWEGLKKMIWEAACSRGGRFEYAIAYITPRVEALYRSRKNLYQRWETAIKSVIPKRPVYKIKK